MIEFLETISLIRRDGTLKSRARRFRLKLSSFKYIFIHFALQTENSAKRLQRIFRQAESRSPEGSSNGYVKANG